MATTTVRIGSETRMVLRELSASTGHPARVILRDALEDYRRKCFLQQANRAYAALRKSKRGWRAEVDERRAWDATLADGVEDR